MASIKYKAFNLHKMIVTFIQHIAVNDLLSAVGGVAPTAIAAIFNVGSSNRFIDFVMTFITYYAATTSAALISALTLGKLLLLKYPLRLRSLSKKYAHKLCTGIWVFCLLVPVQPLLIDKDDVIFDYRVYSSTYTYTSSLWKIVLPVNALIFLVIPGVAVIVSTVLILREAMKIVRETRESLRWQGITTVVLTATVYTTAFLPFTIYFLAEPFVQKDPDNPGKFYLEFRRVAKGALLLNIISNFFIYSLTVASFRRFLVTKFYEIFSACLKKSPSQGNESYS